MRVAAAVRLMAVGAVLHDRRMLPKKWTPAFGMASEAVLVDRALKQLARIRTPVGVVAAGARDLAFAIRHVRGALQLRPTHLVALQAQFRLWLLGADVFGEGCAIARVCRG